MTICNNSVKDTMGQLTDNKISSQVFIAWKFRFFFSACGGLWCFGVIFFEMSFKFKPFSILSDVALLLPLFSCKLHSCSKKTLNNKILWQTSFLQLVTVRIAWR